MFPTIDFDSIEHNIIIIDDVGHFLGVFDRLGILKWENVTKNLPDITILLRKSYRSLREKSGQNFFVKKLWAFEVINLGDVFRHENNAKSRHFIPHRSVVKYEVHNEGFFTSP